MSRSSILCIENEAFKVENRLLKIEVRTLLDTMRCASDVLTKLIFEENEMKPDEIEQEIQDKGLTAPRVTLEDIEANITSAFYFTARRRCLWG